MKPALRFLVVLVDLFSAALLSSQVRPGADPLAPRAVSTYDSIDLSNLNILVNIPVRSVTAGPIPMSESFQGVSQLTRNNWEWAGGFNLGPTEIIGSGLGRMTYTTTTKYTCNPNGDYYHKYSGWRFTDSTGTIYSFPAVYMYANILGSCAPSYDTSEYDINGGGYFILLSSSRQSGLWDRGGNQVVNVFKDPNGNTYQSPNTALGQLVGNQTGTKNTESFQYNDAAGNSRTAVITYDNSTGIPWKTVFGCSNNNDNPGTWNFYPTLSVSLGDGSSFSFSYEQTPGYSGDTTGRLASIVLPTKATISYAYSGGTNGINRVDGTPAVLTRTSPEGTRTYSHVPGTYPNSTTTLVDDAGNETDYVFGNYGSPALLSQATHYQGCASS